ncbi:hypothetical protein ACFYY2_30610 [Streptomyces sp. NPDC001822]|uniref:hypothetical protein n=1 Tax=Streptomyces sp. NPDC001822 TaxID=3364614 RepID=UPI00367E2B49
MSFHVPGVDLSIRVLQYFSGLPAADTCDSPAWLPVCEDTWEAGAASSGGAAIVGRHPETAEVLLAGV